MILTFVAAFNILAILGTVFAGLKAFKK